MEHSSLQLRVDSCQEVIDDISRRLSAEEVNPRIVEQLERLRELLTMLDHHLVSETDLYRIEVSTNQLLRELGVLFSQKEFGSLYDHTLQ
ncbi:MAG: hypothetical protein KQH53_12440 [Desulfarculaceae bacterium]|nr:hypothetical protein [Desulfarculaceae bacterium]